MRTDIDAYLWGVKKIILERKTNDGSKRVSIRCIDSNGEDANANVTVWGERVDGRFDQMTMPEIWLQEEGAEPVCVSEPAPAPSPTTNLPAVMQELQQARDEGSGEPSIAEVMETIAAHLSETPK